MSNCRKRHLDGDVDEGQSVQAKRIKLLDIMRDLDRQARRLQHDREEVLEDLLAVPCDNQCQDNDVKFLQAALVSKSKQLEQAQEQTELDHQQLAEAEQALYISEKNLQDLQKKVQELEAKDKVCHL